MREDHLSPAAVECAEALCAAMEALSRHPQPESQRPEASRLKAEFEQLKSENAGHPELKPYDVRLHRGEKELNALLMQRYEARDLERWEHYTLKCDICRELETLFAGDDSTIRKALPRLKVLHAHWYRLHAVPKEKLAELKARYEAIDQAWRRRLNLYFEQLEAARRDAEVRKTALIEAAEAMQDSTDWNVTAEQFKALQQEWKSLPGAPQERERELFQRFRSACDRFFNARNDWFKERRSVAAEAVGAREACCNELEALDPARNPEGLRRTLEDLRRRWRECGNAGRHTEVLQQRFHAGLDRIYDALRAHTREQLTMRDEWAQRVEQLLLLAESEVGDVSEALQQLSREIGTMRHFERVPGPDGIRAEQREDALAVRYRAAAGRSRMRQNVSALNQAKLGESSTGDAKRCRRLLSELERFAPPEGEQQWSALDLQAAIEANFGGSAETMTLARLDALAAEFLDAGPGAEEIDRFNAALQRAYKKLG